MASTYLVIGLGNPGEEYESTRHNAGRMAVEAFADAIGASEWGSDSKAKSQVAVGSVGTKKIVCALPDTFMNKSGIAAAYLAKAKKTKPENIIVMYDDIDLPLGAIKLSFDRGSGGHRGLESIIRALKTREFARVRIGVSPTTPGGKLRKPHGDEKVVSFLLTKIKEADRAALKKVFKRTSDAIATIIEEGRERAMNVVNSA